MISEQGTNGQGTGRLNPDPVSRQQPNPGLDVRLELDAAGVGAIAGGSSSGSDPEGGLADVGGWLS